MSESVGPAAYRGWSLMKVVALSGRARATRCMHKARHHVSLAQAFDATDARSPKNADAPGEVDDNTLVCDCIPVVYPNFVFDISSREWIKFASRRVWLLPCHPEIGPLGCSFDTREYSELVDWHRPQTRHGSIDW